MNKIFLITFIMGIFCLINVSAYYCYQESANISNQRGTDGNCSLNYSGNYTVSGNTLYVTYKKPANSSSTSLIKIKASTEVNNSINLSCWNYDSNYLYLRVSSCVGSCSPMYTRLECQNSSSNWINMYEYTSTIVQPNKAVDPLNIQYMYDGYWNTMTYYQGNNPNVGWATIGFGGYAGYIYEEAVYWDFPKQSLSFNIFTNISTSDPVCYQESTNVTNQGGIDGNCGLNYSGNVIWSIGQFNPTGNYNNFYDANWGNWNYIYNGDWINETWYMPKHVKGATYKIKGNLETLYVNIPDSCLNRNTNTLNIFISGGSFANWYCMNYSSGNYYNIGVPSYSSIWEDAIIWNITTEFKKSFKIFGTGRFRLWN